MPSLATRRLIDAAGTLGPADRALLNLWVNRGLDDERLTAMTGMSLDALRTRREKIVTRLAAELGLPPEHVRTALVQITPDARTATAAAVRGNGTIVATLNTNGAAPAEANSDDKTAAPPAAANRGAETAAPPEAPQDAAPDTANRGAETAARPEAPRDAPPATANREAETAAATTAANSNAETTAPAATDAGTSTPAAAPAPRRHRTLWLGLAALAIVAIAGIVILATRGSASPAPRRAAPRAAASRRTATSSPATPSPASSPAPTPAAPTPPNQSASTPAAPTPPNQSAPTPAASTPPSQSASTPLPAPALPPGITAPVPLAGLPGGLVQASGTVKLSEVAAELRLKLRVTGLPAAHNGHYEVWLYNSVLSSVALGRLRTGHNKLVMRLPADASGYHWIDVSFQPVGDDIHSGESVLRAANPAHAGSVH